MEQKFELTVQLQRFEERFAILSNQSAGEFKWPIKDFPEHIKINDTFKIKIVTSESEENEKLTAMKKALEDLIN